MALSSPGARIIAAGDAAMSSAPPPGAAGITVTPVKMAWPSRSSSSSAFGASKEPGGWSTRRPMTSMFKSIWKLTIDAMHMRMMALWKRRSQ